MPEVIASELPEIVADLRAARASWRSAHVRHAEYGNLGFPSREAIGQLIDTLSAVLFPIRLGPVDVTLASEDAFVAQSLADAVPLLAAQLERELTYNRTVHGATVDITGDARRIAIGLARQPRPPGRARDRHRGGRSAGVECVSGTDDGHGAGMGHGGLCPASTPMQVRHSGVVRDSAERSRSPVRPEESLFRRR